MALIDNAWYIDYGDGSTTGYYALTKWATGVTKHCGDLIRQNTAPSVGNERVFVCVASTSGTGTTGGAEPTWTVTRGAKNTDNTVTWQEATGIAALNGDLTNTPNWTAVKNTAVTLGQVIQSNDGTKILICTTAGTAGNGAEPTWAAFTNAGATTADNTVTWTTIGSSFAAWAAPHARLSNATLSTWGQSGNSFYVASEHNESDNRSTVTIGVGSAALPSNIVCVTKTTVPPTESNRTTGAIITTTAGAGSQTVLAGTFMWDGISIFSGSGSTFSGSIDFGNGAGVVQRYRNALFKQMSSNANAYFALGPGGGSSRSRVIFEKNCQVQFANASQGFDTNCCWFQWFDTATAVVLGTAPSKLFAKHGNLVTSGPGIIEVNGVDLSNVSGTLVNNDATWQVFAEFVDCKFNSGVTLAAAPVDAGGPIVTAVRCDSAGTDYRAQKSDFGALLTTDSTVARTGGASDGSTSYSWKITTTSGALWATPHESLPFGIWNTTTGANVTVTIEGVYNGAALPNNDDVWAEVSYLGSASSPVASRVTTTKASPLAANAAVTASTQSWDGSASARQNTHAYSVGDVIKLASNPGRVFFCTTAGTSAGSEPGGYASAVDGGSVTDSGAVFRAGVRFKIATTLSAPQPAQAGWLYALIKAAKASSTFYVDPVITLS